MGSNNSTSSDASWVDVSPLEEVADGDAALMVRALQEFNKQLEELDHSYKKALTNRDYEQLRQLHHKLKPSLQLICMPELNQHFDHSRALIQAEQSIDPETFSQLQKKMESLLERIRPELKLHISRWKNA